MVTGVLFLVPSGIAAAGGLAMTYHSNTGDSYSNGLVIGTSFSSKNIFKELCETKLKLKLMLDMIHRFSYGSSCHWDHCRIVLLIICGLFIWKGEVKRCVYVLIASKVHLHSKKKKMETWKQVNSLVSCIF